MSPLTHPPLAANTVTGREPAAQPANRAGRLSGLLWLTWRQHRWALLGSLLLAALLTGWMAYLAAEMSTLHRQCHDTTCSDFSVQHAALYATFSPVRISDILLLVVQYAPLLIGVFIGVPLLAREHEQRTLPLAWSQDISPVRWLWTKLALLGLFVAALSAAVAVESDHLAHARHALRAGILFDDTLFPVSGMLPLALSVCWFAVGVALGAAVKRTLPAAFGAVAGFVGLTVAVHFRYSTLIKPLSVYTQLGQPDTGVLRNNAMVVKGGVTLGPGQATNLFDSAGHKLDYATVQGLCPNAGEDPNATFDCLVRNHLQTHTLYQPGSRIPVFHLILASGYLGLAAVALVVTWLIVRRTDLTVG
jgi:hypothetical protein